MSMVHGRFTLWLDSLGLAPTTRAAYVGDVRRCLTEADLDDADGFRRACQRFIRDTNVSPATTRRRYQAVKLLCRFGSLSPPEAPPLPQVSSGRPKRSEALACRRLDRRMVEDGVPPSGRHVATFRRDRAAALLCAGVGLRPAEILELKIAEIDVRDGRAHITVGLGTRRRELPLPGLVRRALLEYLMAPRPRDVADGGRVFVARKGGPLPCRSLQAGIRRFLLDAGCEERKANARSARGAFMGALIDGVEGNLGELLHIGGIGSGMLSRYLEEKAVRRAKPGRLEGALRRATGGQPGTQRRQ